MRGSRLLLLCTCGLTAACAGTRSPYLRDLGKDRGGEGITWLDGLTKSDNGPPACGPSTCSGCCTAAGSCGSGQSPSQCGNNGSACVDCSAKGYACSSYACAGCKPDCGGKKCGDSDGCGGACSPGSGCCSPSCGGKKCGDPDGCNGTCQQGSGCCSPTCSGKKCGDSDGCNGTCKAGSGCCSPSCNGKKCGDPDGCNGTCQQGSGCCSPSCGGKKCGDPDGCGGTCQIGSGCSPSCGGLLSSKGLPDAGGGCCIFGCTTTQAGGPGATFDCTYCCSSTAGQPACTLPSCGGLLGFKKLPDAGMGCCPAGCATTQAGGPGETNDCSYCCSSTTPVVSVCL